MYSFDYFCNAPSVTFHPGVSANVVSTPAIGATTIGRQNLNKGGEVLLLDGSLCLKAMKQLQVADDVEWI